MERITTEEKYNEKVKAFKSVYEDKSVSIEEKIRLCEEFAYCEYVKGTDRIDYAGDLAEYYLKTGQYKKLSILFLRNLRPILKMWMIGGCL